MTKTSKLDNTIQSKIKALTPQVEQIYQEAKSITIGKGGTEFAVQCAQTIEAIISGAPQQDLDGLKDNLIRLDKLGKIIKEANLGKRETTALSNSISAVKAATKKHIKTKTNTIEKIEKIAATLANKAVDAVGGAFDNDPVVADLLGAASSIGSYVSTKIKDSRKRASERKEEQRRQEREDLSNLQNKKTKNTRKRKEPSETEDDDTESSKSPQNSPTSKPTSSGKKPGLDGASVQVLKTISTDIKSIASHFTQQEAQVEQERADKEEERREGNPVLKRIDQNVKGCLDVLKEILKKDPCCKTDKDKKSLLDRAWEGAKWGVAGAGAYALKKASDSWNKMRGKNSPEPEKPANTNNPEDIQKRAERREKTQRRIRNRMRAPISEATSTGKTALEETLSTPKNLEIEQTGREIKSLKQVLSRNAETESILRQRLKGMGKIPTGKFGSIPKNSFKFNMPSAGTSLNALGSIFGVYSLYESLKEYQNYSKNSEEYGSWLDSLDQNNPSIGLGGQSLKYWWGRKSIESFNAQKSGSPILDNMLGMNNDLETNPKSDAYRFNWSLKKALEAENKKIAEAISHMESEMQPKISLENQEQQNEYLKEIDKNAKVFTKEIEKLRKLYEENAEQIKKMEDAGIQKEQPELTGPLYDGARFQSARFGGDGPRRIPDNQQMPENSDDLKIISKPGDRRVDRGGRVRSHEGYDLEGSFGKPFYSAWDGKVTKVNKQGTGKGGYSVTIKGEDGTVYAAHFDRPPKLNVGDEIKKGTLLGYVGDSGNAKGGTPHIHLERRDSRGRLVTSPPSEREMKIMNGPRPKPIPNPKRDPDKIGSQPQVTQIVYNSSDNRVFNGHSGGGGGGGDVRAISGTSSGGYEQSPYTGHTKARDVLKIA